MKGSVIIGPEFFQKAKNDYSYWKNALVREFLQNSIDAKATEIDVTFEKKEGNEITMKVVDNGCGMSEETLLNKLLSLGSSGKNFVGTVGGFGKAKELLYFAQKDYTIVTRDNFLQGSGASFELLKNDVPVVGTVSQITMSNESETASWVSRTKMYIGSLEFGGKITINGEVYANRTIKQEEVGDLGFATVYRSPATGKNTVRVHGITMFERDTSTEFGTIIELKNAYTDLSANRDGLQYDARQAMDKFIDSLVVDCKSGLRKKSTKKVVYKGKIYTDKYKNTTDNEFATAPSGTSGGTLKTELRFSNDFTYVVHNETGESIPSHLQLEYMPANVRWIKDAYAVALWQIHKMCRANIYFRVGFVINSEAEAMYEDYTFSLNPLDENGLVRFKKTKEDCSKIASAALHEFVHSIGYGYHDERYSSKLTQCTEVLLLNWSTLQRQMLAASTFFKD